MNPSNPIRLLSRTAISTLIIVGVIGLVSPVFAAGKGLLWVQPLSNHPVHKIMQAGFLTKCAKLARACKVVGNPSATNYDIPATLLLAEAALSRSDYGAVAVYAADPAIFPFISKLAHEGYPVVTCHVLPAEGTVNGLLAATGEDIGEAGAQAAVALADKLGGKGVIALTQGSINETENAMSAAFRAKIAQSYPGITVLNTQIEGFEPSAAQAKAVAILQGHPKVNGAFSTTGNGPQAWAQAARATGRNIVIIGMDYIRQNLDLVKADQVFGLVAQPLYEEGVRVAELAAALADGKKVNYRNPLPARVITANDLAPYYQILKEAGQ